MRSLQVLGAGCSKCAKLYQHAQEAVKEAGLEATVEKVTDITAIIGFGVVRTPALVIDGEVKFVGQVPSVAEIKAILA